MNNPNKEHTVLETNIEPLTVLKEHAETVIDAFSEWKISRDVYLYGSLGRGNAFDSDNIDLIVTVDDKVFDWMHGKNGGTIPDDEVLGRYIQQQDRGRTNHKNIGPDGAERVVDILYLPHDWKSRLDELADLLPKENSSFIFNVADDARLVN